MEYDYIKRSLDGRLKLRRVSMYVIGFKAGWRSFSPGLIRITCFRSQITQSTTTNCPHQRYLRVDLGF